MLDPHALGIYRQVTAAWEDSPPSTPILLESSAHAYSAHVARLLKQTVLDGAERMPSNSWFPSMLWAPEGDSGRYRSRLHSCPGKNKASCSTQQAFTGPHCLLSSGGQLDDRQPLHSWSTHASEDHRTVGFAKCVLEIEASKEDGARGKSLQSVLRKGPLLHGDVVFAQSPRWRDLCERPALPSM